MGAIISTYNPVNSTFSSIVSTSSSVASISVTVDRNLITSNVYNTLKTFKIDIIDVSCAEKILILPYKWSVKFEENKYHCMTHENIPAFIIGSIIEFVNFDIIKRRELIDNLDERTIREYQLKYQEILKKYIGTTDKKSMCSTDKKSISLQAVSFIDEEINYEGFMSKSKFWIGNCDPKDADTVIELLRVTIGYLPQFRKYDAISAYHDKRCIIHTYWKKVKIHVDM